ncbi:unnamed protein product [Chironomus riparius]|uniref:Fucosyltransferase n=1 Tax=Chironomus riparius TaxID=315576 RepID=A0A9N9S6W3_9DIPT|nr:unnamed protein product [Chironomus riparius]
MHISLSICSTPKRSSRDNPCNLLIKLTKLFIVLLLSIYLFDDISTYRDTQVDSFKLSVPFTNVPKTSQRNESLKYILFWTTWWYFPLWYMGKEVQGEEYLKSIDCPVTNCVFSHDRHLLPRPTDYDALVFHVGDCLDIDDLPSARREDQFYVVADEETSFFSWHNFKLDDNFFNMTLTYRLDADILWNYGLFIDKETGTWFLSHCNTNSNRDHLGKKIQEYMNIDIYGLCGNLTCQIPSIYNETARRTCTDMLNSTYKFYLSFENSICTDYMTEKVYLNMDNYIVPILYNGITDMQHFLPPHSYIHVNDSSSVEDLVNYLKYLDKNPQEYANYFWWKKYYKVLTNAHSYAYCDMCMKVNEWNTKQKRQSYNDLNGWLTQKTCYNMSKNF